MPESFVVWGGDFMAKSFPV